MKSNDLPQLIKPSLEERFYKYVDRSAGPDGCWIWTGCLGSTNGEVTYGQISVDGRMLKAHRVAWELQHGPIPEGMVIDHFVCFDKRCVNVAHLRVTTPKINARNQGAVRCDNTSGIRGVAWDKRNAKWVAYITVDGKKKSLGYFTDKAAAETTWLEAERKYHPESSRVVLGDDPYRRDHHSEYVKTA